MDQWSKISENLANRKSEKVIRNLVSTQEDTLFISCPNDLGVARNGGRIGARYAPQAIIQNVNKLAATSQKSSFAQVTLDSYNWSEDFTAYQNDLTDKIIQAVASSSAKRFIHLGGGHDHIYPYLRSLENKAEKIVVFNIDAHLDTRTDSLSHSGTPFRQFSRESKCEFELIQIGIHNYANPSSNFEQLEKGKMLTYYFDTLCHMTQNFSQPTALLSRHISNTPNTHYIFSLDCDALSANEMSGVSAVNHRGLPASFVMNLLEEFKREFSENSHLGIYEYNPLYDDLSEKGARLLAQMIYSFIS